MQDSSPKAKNKDAPRRKIPKKITESYLHNYGLYYIERFSSSSENFRRTMMRKVDNSCRHHKEQNREICVALVDALVEKFVRSGLLNDRQYAENMVYSLRRRGHSARAIESKLKTKGVPADLIRKYLHDEEEDTDAEYKAALAFARKRRIGPFSKRQREDEAKKAMATMARAGFGFDISRKVLNLKSDEFTEEF